jgi:hypothetical protein
MPLHGLDLVGGGGRGEDLALQEGLYVLVGHSGPDEDSAGLGLAVLVGEDQQVAERALDAELAGGELAFKLLELLVELGALGARLLYEGQVQQGGHVEAHHYSRTGGTMFFRSAAGAGARLKRGEAQG